MKNILTAIVAMTITFSATAAHAHSAKCEEKCNILTRSSASVPTESQQKIAALKNKAEEKESEMNFHKTMTGTMQLLERQKWEQAKENLIAKGAYKQMMSTMLSKIKTDKAINEMMELEANIRFEQLMANTFAK
jgi:hypothetical protein